MKGKLRNDCDPYIVRADYQIVMGIIGSKNGVNKAIWCVIYPFSGIERGHQNLGSRLLEGLFLVEEAVGIRGNSFSVIFLELVRRVWSSFNGYRHGFDAWTNRIGMM